MTEQSTEIKPPEPPPPVELPRSSEATPEWTVVKQRSERDDGPAATQAAEHQDARSAAQAEFAEASRGLEQVDQFESTKPEQAQADGPPAEEAPPTRGAEHERARSAASDEFEAARAAADQAPQGNETASAVEVLGPAEKDEFRAYEQQLVADGKTRAVTGTGDEFDYQRRHCGDIEYRLTGDDALPNATWADGLNREEGLAQDAKYVGTDGPSFYKPDSLPPFLAEQATNAMDIRLTKYKDVVEDPSNPTRGLEIITNDRDAATFFASRMDALGVPGKVTQRD